MNAWEVLQDAMRQQLTGEDGAPIALSPRPGLEEDEIAALEEERGFRLPGELRELLRRCSGLDGLEEELDFTAGFGLEEAFPRSVAVAGDRCGNFWVVDASPEGAEVAPVFFACHDPPVVLYQAPTLASFLAELLRGYRPPHESAVKQVQTDGVFRVWRENPATMTVAEALRGDPELRQFAAGLYEGCLVVDLRAPAVGMGFSWGRNRSDPHVRRHGDHRIFAYVPPQKGFWGRLFGR